MALRRRWQASDGQDLLEYALIGAFVSILVLAGASGLGSSVGGWFDALAQIAEAGAKKSNCSAQGMVSSGGKCHGG